MTEPLTLTTMNNLAIKSFYPCNQLEGGPSLNTDIYLGSSLKAEFKDICGCRDLPKALQIVDSSLEADNHGNSFMKYTEAKCQGQGVFVPGGRNIMSTYFTSVVQREDDIYPIVRGSVAYKSIGPVVNSLYYQNHCIKLTNTIYKFEFEDDPVGSPHLTIFEKADSLRSVATNNGGGKITEHFQAKMEVTEGVEVEIGESISNMHKVGVEANLEIESKAGIPGLAGGGFKVGLKTAYEHENAAERSNSTKRVVQERKKWQVEKSVEVLPCTETRVNSVLEMVKDKEMRFRVYGRVTGKIAKNGRPLTAGMIRKNLGADLEVLEDVDNWTVAIVGKGVAKTSFGIEMVTEVDSHKIAGCTT